MIWGEDYMLYLEEKKDWIMVAWQGKMIFLK